MAELTNIVVDSNHNGFIYGATDAGEILMFKTEKLLQNPEMIKCSIQAKLKVHTSEHDTKQLKVVSLKNYLLAVKPDGNLEMYDMTKMNDFLLRPVGYPIKLALDNIKLSNDGVPDILSIKSFNGDLILIGVSPDANNNKVVLYEGLTPALQESKEYEMFNFKFPMFFIAFAVVLVFQFLNRKEGENNDILSIVLGW